MRPATPSRPEDLLKNHFSRWRERPSWAMVGCPRKTQSQVEMTPDKHVGLISKREHHEETSFDGYADGLRADGDCASRGRLGQFQIQRRPELARAKRQQQ